MAIHKKLATSGSLSTTREGFPTRPQREVLMTSCFSLWIIQPCRTRYGLGLALNACHDYTIYTAFLLDSKTPPPEIRPFQLKRKIRWGGISKNESKGGFLVGRARVCPRRRQGGASAILLEIGSNFSVQGSQIATFAPRERRLTGGTQCRPLVFQGGR